MRKHNKYKTNKNHHSNALNQTIIKAITNDDVITINTLLLENHNAQDETDGGYSSFESTQPLDNIKKLLLKYEKLDWKTMQLNKFKDTVLHYASRLGKVNLIKLFLESKNFDINVCNNNGDTPLLIACDCGHTEVAKLLVKYDANCNCENINFKTPLILASELLSPYDIEMCKILIEEGNALVNYQTNNLNHVLLSASKFGNLDLIKYLVSLNSDVNLKFNDGATALMRACYYNHLGVVEFFVNNNASIEETNNRKETPLYIAAYRGHDEIVKLLIEMNANINSEDIDGDTPLTVACYEDKPWIISLLLKNGANVNKKVRNILKRLLKFLI
jgi:ankyrin repeat protein